MQILLGTSGQFHEKEKKGKDAAGQFLVTGYQICNSRMMGPEIP